MKLLPSGGWLLVLAMTALIVSATALARDWLLADVRDRLSQKYQQRVAAFSERQAALLVRRLAQNDDQWLDALVAAAADDRPAVAAAAETELREMVDRWAELPQQHSAQIAGLARLLAQQAPLLPAQRRDLAHALVQKIIDLPVDGEHVDAAQLIADCQPVLVLPRAERAELRVAAATATSPDPPRETQPAAPPVLPAD